MTPGDILGVTAVGVVVGVDLVTVPQAMVSRPLVAAFVGGWLVGSPAYGLLIGAVLELFALETLPVGAARYPDWGPPAVAAGALFPPGPGGVFTAPFWPWLLSLVLVTGVVAWLGGWAMDGVHRANGAAIRRRAAELEAGDPRALVRLQAWGFVRDAARAAVLTLVALVPGGFVAKVVALQWHAPGILAETTVLAVAAGVAAASAWRLHARGRPARWLFGGAAAGLAGALLWA